MRTKSEILDLIAELETQTEKIRANMNQWNDRDVPLEMIRENTYRMHTLEWVLGKHDRWD